MRRRRLLVEQIGEIAAELIGVERAAEDIEEEHVQQKATDGGATPGELSAISRQLESEALTADC